ncbi:MAG: HtaA domain-containing protein [Nocardioides sp.]
MSSRQLLLRYAAAGGCLAVVAAGSTTTAANGATHHASRGHATYVVFKGGATALALNPTTAQALTDNGISVSTVGEAKSTKAGIAFPIQGGLIKAKTLGGSITHSGGLMFSAGGKDLTIRDFTINTKKKTLSAWVDQVGARITVLNLNLGHAKVKVTKKHTTVKGVRAVLAKGAASALNAYYSTTLFTGGLKIGTAMVSGKTKLLAG